MNKTNCYIYAFATFGHPNDFRQTPFLYNNPDVAQKIKVFDLSNAIKVFPDSKIYSIRKEKIGNVNLIAYAIYTYAQEQASKRDGTFIGSSIILENELSEENLIISCLNEFHKKLTEKNLQNGVLKVNHSKDFVPVENLKDFDKINFNLREIDNLNFAQNSNKQLVVYCATIPNKLQHIFKKSIGLLNVYDTIYFTKSEDVAKFVQQRGIFPIIDEKEFDSKIQKLEEERKRIIQAFHDELTREKQELEEYTKKLDSEYNKQIEENKKQYEENNKRIEEYTVNYLRNIEIYAKSLDDSMSNLNKKEKFDNVRQQHIENKQKFNDSINKQEKPKLINSNWATNTPATSESPQYPTTPRTKQKTHSERQSDYSHESWGFGIWKTATVVLFLLWMGTLMYFLLFNKPEKEMVIINEPTQELTAPEDTETMPIQELNPIPNEELNEHDYRLIAKKIKYDTEVNEVVEIIFKNNPTDIKNNYDEQQDVYSKQLIEKNKDCFEYKSGIFYFVKDTLRHIPSYKKQ